MFWDKKRTSLVPGRGGEAELDQAVETLAELLRGRGRYAFAVDDDSAESIGKNFEDWARHVLVRTLPPGEEPVEGQEPDSTRQWLKLARFATAHWKKEQTYVKRSVSDAREAIMVLVECFSKTSVTQSKNDKMLVERISGLKGAVASGSMEDLKREALAMASALTHALDEQRTLQKKQADDLRERLVSLSQQLEQTKRDADTDALTRLVNRRGFDLASERAVAMASVLDKPLTMLMVDLDHFKHINDRFGHPAGDQVLRNVADSLVRCFPRRTDVVARYGGEEFAILLTDTELKDGRMLADRLLRAVRSLSVGLGAGAVPVTVSVGLAQLGPGEDAAALLARADKALYAAKNTGRNRLVQSGGKEEAVPSSVRKAS